MVSTQTIVLKELATIRLEVAQQAELLQVFGLQWTIAKGPDYLTLDEALSNRVLEVSEMDGKGRVPEIKVTNRSDRMVFLMIGEILAGCKQDRVLNTSLMLPAGKEMSIPVACVEAGRWNSKSAKFQSFHSCSHFDLRKVLFTGTAARYRATGVPGSDQKAVWTEISRKMQKMEIQSSTSAVKDMYENAVVKLNRLEQNFCVPAECQGAAFAIDGKILGADLFDTRSTFCKLWPKLIRSYGIEALEDYKGGSRPLQPGTVAKWLESAIAARIDSFESPGIGLDVRIEGETVAGAALVVGESPVHLQLFSKVSESRDPSRKAGALDTIPEAGVGAEGVEQTLDVKIRDTVRTFLKAFLNP